MSAIYNDMKHGYKINIGQDIGERVRSFTFNNGWEQFNDETVDNILNGVLRNYFILKTIQENAYAHQDYEELKELLQEKIYASFDKFENQDATARQVYYYISLCNEIGEEPEQIINNRDISIEIKRLKELYEQQEETVV